MSKDFFTAFKASLFSGKPVLGLFMKTSDVFFVEASGHAGFDFAVLDMEHGPVSFEKMKELVIAAENTGLSPIIRVSSNNEECIGKALDLGASGVQIPQIRTGRDALNAVEYSKFSPDGKRGVCRFVRAADYSSKDRYEYFKEANETLVIIHIEGKEGIENIDEIINVKGIDIIFIGPYDLSQSLGLPGQTSHPVVIEEMKKIVKKAKTAGKITGTFVDNPESMSLWIQVGIQYIAYSVDVGIYLDACVGIKKSFQDNCFK